MKAFVASLAIALLSTTAFAANLQAPVVVPLPAAIAKQPTALYEKLVLFLNSETAKEIKMASAEVIFCF